MNIVFKSELKAKMLEYFRKIEKTGEDMIVTDNKKPVIKVTTLKSKRTPDDVFRNYRDKVRFYDDITADTSEEWTVKM